jgi:antirestriction protein ArdC
MSNKIYEIVTKQVVDKIQDAITKMENGEQALAPWQKSWTQAQTPQNIVTKKPYRGMNIFLLSMNGYASPFYASYAQITKLGGKVKKGEKGHMVVFWKWVKLDKDEQGHKLDKAKNIPFLRYYTVFNIEQTEGIPEKKIPKFEERDFNAIDEAEKVLADMPSDMPEIRHIEDRAYYSPSLDYVNMPPQKTFKSDEAYYSVLFHELTHSTGHKSRLSRTEVTDMNSFGSHSYSVEELVAEMGAVFLSSHCGIEHKTMDNSIAYLKGWLSKLKDDTKMLITAAGRAQKASDYILNQTFEQKAQEKEEEEEKELA